MSNFKSGWYLIYTKPRHEKKVQAQLAERNINCFLPLTKKLRQWNDRKKYVDEPLFPSYIFIYLEELHHYYHGLDADGSLYYVRTGNEIACVKESVIDNIRLVVNKGSNLEVSDTRFKAGHRLVITKGALTGLSCEVVQFENLQKVLVRVDLLQRNLLMTLSEADLMDLNN